MRKALIALAGALLLGGCATQIMQGFVGQPVEQIMVRYGPPVGVFDMPDGRRAFQWRIDSSTVTPGTATTNAYAYGNYGTATTTYMPAQQINQSCIYTMYATEGPAGRWTVVGYEKPSLACY